jgi:hypothetical protein
MATIRRTRLVILNPEDLPKFEQIRYMRNGTFRETVLKKSSAPLIPKWMDGNADRTKASAEVRELEGGISCLRGEAGHRGTETREIRKDELQKARAQSKSSPRNGEGKKPG